MRQKKASPSFQFSKYIGDERGGVGIQFDFPLAPWSKDYFDRLKQALDQRSIIYTVYEVPESDSFNITVTKFIEIDLGQDLKAASELARLTLVEVFNLNQNETLTIYFDNVSPKDEKIGFD